jgi:phospholipase C
MLQENRSFDQYLSNLNNYRAARGYSTEVDVASPTATQPQDNGNYISRFHMRTMCIEELSPNWLESHGDANRWNPSSDNLLMDGFVHTAQGMANWSGFWDKGGYRAMGYYTEADLPYYYFMATQFATSDRWFSPVPTNSTVNRVYGFAATSAGHAHDASWTISNKTIFQLLAENGHTWKIYYTDVDSNGTPASRIWRFQPFASNNKSHIVPMSEFYTDIANGTLPDYAFIESGFLSGRDEHPGGTLSGNPNSGNHVQRGAAYAASIINALMKSPSWHDSAFILSWDEVGGPYDHVKPMMNIPSPDGIPPLDLYSGDPSGDFTRSGFRVPMMVVSPWSKPHYVSHTPMDYTAVLKLVETRFGLSPLTARDAAQPDMTEFFDFVNKPWATPPTPPIQPTNGECNYTDMP